MCGEHRTFEQNQPRASWDHPRMCGEHALASAQTAFQMGSSPHVRGALGDGLVDAETVGIIPACAGSTSKWYSSVSCDWDHPRMCGEHRERAEHHAPIMGSSPHVRGAPNRAALGTDDLGIIPACAGSTVSWRTDRSPCRDHPRMCGEHSVRISPASMTTGSSPHVRGAHDGSHATTPIGGIIPACAGSTSSMRLRVQPPRDHPRMCGEHHLVDSRSEYGQGSSPHVRGARDRLQARKGVERIIPACAGSTLRK